MITNQSTHVEWIEECLFGLRIIIGRDVEMMKQDVSLLRDVIIDKESV